DSARGSRERRDGRASRPIARSPALPLSHSPALPLSRSRLLSPNRGPDHQAHADQENDRDHDPIEEALIHAILDQEAEPNPRADTGHSQRGRLEQLAAVEPERGIAHDLDTRA